MVSAKVGSPHPKPTPAQVTKHVDASASSASRAIACHDMGDLTTVAVTIRWDGATRTANSSWFSLPKQKSEAACP
jgi:hypothetical protein